MPDRATGQRLTIRKQWDGTAALEEEEVAIDLDWDERRLRIDVAAPFWDDPLPGDPVGSTERLWEFEVVELFVASAVDPRQYIEIELGPAGHYLVLRFFDVRQRAPFSIPLDFTTTASNTGWAGVARLASAHLPARPWRANAFSLHGIGADRRYLAAFALPGAQPDFHQPERFPQLCCAKRAEGNCAGGDGAEGSRAGGSRAEAAEEKT